MSLTLQLNLVPLTRPLPIRRSHRRSHCPLVLHRQALAWVSANANRRLGSEVISSTLRVWKVGGLLATRFPGDTSAPAESRTVKRESSSGPAAVPPGGSRGPLRTEGRRNSRLLLSPALSPKLRGRKCLYRLSLTLAGGEGQSPRCGLRFGLRCEIPSVGGLRSACAKYACIAAHVTRGTSTPRGPSPVKCGR